MKDTPKAPAKDTPEPSAMERMREFARSIIALPKSELAAKSKAKRRRPQQ